MTLYGAAVFDSEPNVVQVVCRCEKGNTESAIEHSLILVNANALRCAEILQCANKFFSR